MRHISPGFFALILMLLLQGCVQSTSTRGMSMIKTAPADAASDDTAAAMAAPAWPEADPTRPTEDLPGPSATVPTDHSTQADADYLAFLATIQPAAGASETVTVSTPTEPIAASIEIDISTLPLPSPAPVTQPDATSTPVPTSSPAPVPEPIPEPIPEPVPDPGPDPVPDPGPVQDYSVTLQAEKHLRKPGSPGELRISISAPEQAPALPTNFVSDSQAFSSSGQSARVEPYVPDFDILGPSSVCMPLDPSGSTARFTIVPRKAGVLKVGASVHLFPAADCQGTALIKQPENLQVEVTVDWWAAVLQRIDTLWQVAWQKFVNFWGWLVGLGLGLAAYLIQRWVKQRFNYEHPKPGS